MNQKEIKANMTQGTWSVTPVNVVVNINNGNIDFWHFDNKMVGHNPTANATAVTHAINNTYGKNINPESVPDMYNALTLIEKDLRALNMVEIADKLQDILKNATL
jgi:hypothetical protein